MNIGNIAGVGFVVFGGLSAAWSADLTNCAAVSENPGNYKVVLDSFLSPTAMPADNRDVSNLWQRLLYKYDNQLQHLSNEASKLNRETGLRLLIITCSNRHPSETGSEFRDAPLAERLSDQGVVTEMWGILNIGAPDSADPGAHALINYAIPPVTHYVTKDRPRGLLFTSFPQKGTEASPADMLANLPELSATVLIGLGTKAQRAHDYDLAAWAFGHAGTAIKDARLTNDSDDLRDLALYAADETCHTQQLARLDQNYHGALKLLPDRPCGGRD